MRSVSVRQHFVLGYGSAGTAGDVTLTLSILSTPMDVRVTWTAAESNAQIRERAIACAEHFLAGYVEAHPQVGLWAVITKYVIDPVRRNEPERVVSFGLCKAIEMLSLPVVPYFAPPDDPAFA
jgi:hypothetical protein